MTEFHLTGGTTLIDSSLAGTALSFFPFNAGGRVLLLAGGSEAGSTQSAQEASTAASLSVDCPACTILFFAILSVTWILREFPGFVKDFSAPLRQMIL